MAQNNAVVQAIMSATQNPQIQAAMLLGSRMESNWSTTAVGDNGTSLGPFQIHLPAHPGVSAAEAEDPNWAVHYMLPAYTAGVSQVPASLWGSNPALAAATAAYHAERPAKMYPSSAYVSDWNQYVLPALGGNSSAVTSGGTGATTAASTTSLTSSIFGPLNQSLNSAFMGLVMVTGLVLMAVGAVLVFRDAFKTTGVQPINVTLKGKTNVDARPTQTTSTEPRSPKPYRIVNPKNGRTVTRPIGLSPRPTRATATRVKPAPRVVESGPKEIAA